MIMGDTKRKKPSELIAEMRDKQGIGFKRVSECTYLVGELKKNTNKYEQE